MKIGLFDVFGAHCRILVEKLHGTVWLVLVRLDFSRSQQCEDTSLTYRLPGPDYAYYNHVQYYVYIYIYDYIYIWLNICIYIYIMYMSIAFSRSSAELKASKTHKMNYDEWCTYHLMEPVVLLKKYVGVDLRGWNIYTSHWDHRGNWQMCGI